MEALLQLSSELLLSMAFPTPIVSQDIPLPEWPSPRGWFAPQHPMLTLMPALEIAEVTPKEVFVHFQKDAPYK